MQEAWQLGATYVAEEKGNIYLSKGEPSSFYPCFVAHTDTVHTIVPNARYEVYHDPKNPYLEAELFALDPTDNTPRGVGGDDKCGIMLALSMLRHLPNVKLAFFRDEENGCKGAEDADLSFFQDCAFVIECDRRGAGDIIRTSSSTELYNDDFAKHIDPVVSLLGYKNNWGTVTDVLTLVENGVGISCANVSAGYYLPHSEYTYVQPNDVARTLQLIRGIAERDTNTRWEHAYRKSNIHVRRWMGDDWSEWEGPYNGYGMTPYYNQHKYQPTQSSLNLRAFPRRKTIWAEKYPAFETPPCPRCGASVSSSSWWCSTCQVFADTLCFTCGTKLPTEAATATCTTCGEDINTSLIAESGETGLITVDSIADIDATACPDCGALLMYDDTEDVAYCFVCDQSKPAVWPGPQANDVERDVESYVRDHTYSD